MIIAILLSLFLNDALLRNSQIPVDETSRAL